jgi:carbonic anhydrase/acetyltransferase-like protein (isoleucine patch superfamily)
MSARAPHILPYSGISPSFGTPPVHAGVASAVLGRVAVGRNAWLGALSVMRADGHFVRVGDDFHLGPRSTLHINHAHRMRSVQYAHDGFEKHRLDTIGRRTHNSDQRFGRAAKGLIQALEKLTIEP